MAVDFLPSQIGTHESVPLPYTGSPLQLLWSDIILFFRSARFLLGIIFPWKPWRSMELDELSPSSRNLTALAIHAFLVVYQLGFLVSLPFCLLCPLFLFLLYVAVFVFVNSLICRLLNGPNRLLESQVPIAFRPEHKEERWIFVNGVAVGHHWLQSNLDQLSRTFGRRIAGVHNPTMGIIFDVIGCLIQRNFCYATDDIRDGHTLVKKALLNQKYKKIVLILHSQGGIYGSLIVDWLLAEIPQDLLLKLEVYTFGNAANHFNNPHKRISELKRAISDGQHSPQSKAIRYIEHYANSRDFVCVWGVLNFIQMSNRYMGRIFVRQGAGHQLNQHYLDNMFPLSPDGKVLDTNDFMESTFRPRRELTQGDKGETLVCSLHSSSGIPQEPYVGGKSSSINAAGDTRYEVSLQDLKVKDLSRLWQYRNGQSPNPDMEGSRSSQVDTNVSVKF